jgi:hypothetical protein
MTTNFFHPFLLLLFLDPGWVKIRIRDKHSGSNRKVQREYDKHIHKERHLIECFFYWQHWPQIPPPLPPRLPKKLDSGRRVAPI